MCITVNFMDILCHYTMFSVIFLPFEHKLGNIVDGSKRDYSKHG